MVRFRWWNEHQRLCESGVLTTVKGHFKGLSDLSTEVRSRYIFAAQVAGGGLVKNRRFYQPRKHCPQCQRTTHYFTDDNSSHAWFDTISPDNWRTHSCMGKVETKCSPDWMNSPEASLEQKRLEAERFEHQIKAELAHKNRADLFERKQKLLTIQRRSGVKTNSTCPKCKVSIYVFKSGSGETKSFDSLYPYWQTHECMASNEENGEASKDTPLSESHETHSSSPVGEKRPLVLKKSRRIIIKPRLSPVELLKNENISEADRQHILCKLLAATTYQNGYRLRLNPVPLPKVDMVVFCEIDALDIEGVKFVNLNDTEMSFLSSNSLSPIKAIVEYVTIRKM